MLRSDFNYSKPVEDAIRSGKPILALESTIIAHGMPYPENAEFAREAETLARENGAEPATIGILNGKICVGLDDQQLEKLASSDDIAKISTRDIGSILAHGGHGATTVSATMKIAHAAGIEVFATGGIGGVHRGVEEHLDISADLIELSRTPVIVVSAGAKAILDLPRTLEYLETLSVPVVGFATNRFPAFYSKDSGLNLTLRVDTSEEIAKIFRAQCTLDISSGMLVANPVSFSDEIPLREMEEIISHALKSAKDMAVSGKALTPYLLAQIVELTNGRSLKTNRALALNNVKLGAQIACSLSELA